MANSKKPHASVVGEGSVFSSMSGPSDKAGSLPPNADENKQRLHEKVDSGKDLAAGMSHNPTKAGEYGEKAAQPQQGATVEPSSPLTTASTAAENQASDKLGAGKPVIGVDPTVEPLDRVRVDAGGQMMTTNQGVRIADNQNSLKAGLRGPTAMEDFILREKLTHFDHERIPERVVHARGSAAHGYFEAYDDFSELTMAAPFAAAGKQTPIFVRFSQVAGERGSIDTARDVRGFAIKFYTDAGNWDLVGNNMPVFHIQDAMKFPDLVHALKPEPHHAMPQASSAHDTFWDFVSLMPESTHMLLWQMSDRAIPRSYRMMQGFGVHTFRFVNAEGKSVFCKFHWNPTAGTHGLIWDEAVKISGADPDFLRRDLWEAIEAGEYPEWELGVQIFTEEQAEGFSFDVLDSTKLIPEELVPIKPLGKMTLNRNPDNFFAETEQVAFCTAHIIPGIDFTNDPLLQGRIHSYVDTQLIRLGGPNFHEIPINAPVVPVFNNQRDGMHRQAIHRGRVSYEPNSLGGGCPFQAGMQGFTSFPQRVEADMVRGKAELFAEHYGQATLFWESQTKEEQNHIAGAFRFELTRVQTPAIRERIVSMLRNVDETLASTVAKGLGLELPAPMPRASDQPIPEYPPSPPLSMSAHPGKTGIRTKRVALFAADGMDGDVIANIYETLLAQGAVPRLVGSRLGKITTLQGQKLDIEVTLEAAPSVLHDAVVLPEGKEAIDKLMMDAHSREFVRDQYRHCKPILALGEGKRLLEKLEIPQDLPNGQPDPALVVESSQNGDKALTAFIAALAAPRCLERETDPPRV